MSVRDKLEQLKPTRFEKALGMIAPRSALVRMEARHRLLEFEWRAANPGRRSAHSGGRSHNSTTQSPLSQRQRVKLIWEARRAYRNIPVVSVVVNRLAEYVIPQVTYQADTGDDNLDDDYEAYWRDWAAHSADMTGRTDLAGLLKLGFIHMLVDGDFFFHPIHTDDSYTLQCIEGDRIGHPDMAGGEADPNIISGVMIDQMGRPQGYQLFNRDKNGNYQPNLDQPILPAEQMLPLMSLESADQVRGVTLFCRVLDQVKDLYEAFEFERGAAKWAASYAGIIYEKDGRNPRSGVGAAEFDGVSHNGTPTQEVKANTLLRLNQGESVTPFPPSNRPSGAFMALIDATIRDIAMGVDLPFGFFDMRGFGGATSRLEANQIQRKINAWQALLKRAVLNPLRDRVIYKAIQLGHLPPTPHPFEGAWTFGPHITADLGYQTNADLALLAANLTTASKLAAAQGYDYKELVSARGREIRELHKVAIENQVPIELLNPNFASASQMFADLEAAQNPPPRVKPTIQEAGERVSKQVLDLITQVAEGTLPREQAIQTLIYVYQMPKARAEAITPLQAAAIPPATSSNQ